jgi:hypothetical protein
MQIMASAVIFLERYQKDGDEFLNHIVTGDKTWVSFVNVNTHSTNNPNKFKQTLSAGQKVDVNCFLRQERSVDGGIHATMDHNNAKRVCETPK